MAKDKEENLDEYLCQCGNWLDLEECEVCSECL